MIDCSLVALLSARCLSAEDTWKMETTDASGPNPSLHSQMQKFFENNKKQELFPSSWPQEFWTRVERKFLLEEVWRSLLHLFIRALWGSLCGGLRVRTFLCTNVYTCNCVCVLKRSERFRKGREGGRASWLGISVFCFLCLGLVLEMKGSGGGGVGAGGCNLYLSVSLHSKGTGVSLLWVSATSCIVPVTSQKQQRRKTGIVPIRMEQANICLSQKNPD